jgi:thioredoxin-dependent peroxiredoxin
MSELTNKKAPKIKGINFSKNEFTVIYFYPKDSTPGCTIEAKEFTDLVTEFKKLKTEIYGISKDSEKSHCNFIKKENLKIKLIPDTENEIQDKYNVRQKKKFMGHEFIGTVRSTFLIDKKGKVIKTWNNVKPKEHAKNVLEFIKNGK